MTSVVAPTTVAPTTTLAVPPPRVEVVQGTFDGRGCPVTITLVNGVPGSWYSVVIDIVGNAGSAQFRPRFRSPDFVADTGLLEPGQSLTTATADIYDGPGTGNPIAITVPNVLCVAR